MFLEEDDGLLEDDNNFLICGEVITAVVTVDFDLEILDQLFELG